MNTHVIMGSVFQRDGFVMAMMTVMTTQMNLKTYAVSTGIYKLITNLW